MVPLRGSNGDGGRFQSVIVAFDGSPYATNQGVLMNRITRLGGLILLAPIAGFFVFGFLATFEPLPEKSRTVFRSAYVLGLCGCGAAALWLIRGIWQHSTERSSSLDERGE